MFAPSYRIYLAVFIWKHILINMISLILDRLSLCEISWLFDLLFVIIGHFAHLGSVSFIGLLFEILYFSIITTVEHMFLWDYLTLLGWFRGWGILYSVWRFMYNMYVLFVFLRLLRRILLIGSKWVTKHNLGTPAMICKVGTGHFKTHEQMIRIGVFRRRLLKLMESLGQIAVLKIYLFDFWGIVVFGCYWVTRRHFGVCFQKVAFFVVALDARMAGLIHRVFGDILFFEYVITTLKRYILTMCEFEQKLGLVEVDIWQFVLVDISDQIQNKPPTGLALLFL